MTHACRLPLVKLTLINGCQGQIEEFAVAGRLFRAGGAVIALMMGGPAERILVPGIVEAQLNLPVITGLDPVICRRRCGDRWLGQAQP